MTPERFELLRVLQVRQLQGWDQAKDADLGTQRAQGDRAGPGSSRAGKGLGLD